MYYVMYECYTFTHSPWPRDVVSFPFQIDWYSDSWVRRGALRIWYVSNGDCEFRHRERRLFPTSSAIYDNLSL